MSDDNRTEVDAEIAGQKLKVTGPGANLIFTIVGAIASAFAAYLVFTHGAEAKVDARDASQALQKAIESFTAGQKEQTMVLRETTCLMNYQGPPAEKADFCRRMAR